MSRFVDRSNVNGADDYRTARVGLLYLKATEGISFVDGTRRNRLAQARAEGVAMIGDYHFADLDNPLAEADHFYSVCGRPAPGQLRPCLDLERGQVINDQAWAEAFITRMRTHLGYLPAIYGSTSLIAPLRQRSALIRSCPWWRAEYGPNDGALHPLQGGNLGAAAHQYTSVARVSGLSGNVDASVLLSPTALLVPHPKVVVRITRAAWLWAQWWLSIGAYKGHGHAEHAASRGPGQKDGRVPVPHGGWAAVKWYLKHRKPGA